MDCLYLIRRAFKLAKLGSFHIGRERPLPSSVSHVSQVAEHLTEMEISGAEASMARTTDAQVGYVSVTMGRCSTGYVVRGCSPSFYTYDQVAAGRSYCDLINPFIAHIHKIEQVTYGRGRRSWPSGWVPEVEVSDLLRQCLFYGKYAPMISPYTHASISFSTICTCIWRSLYLYLL